MEHYICVHGHFYQPPRENPWLESIELQHSAYPYHDWNERVTEECYSTNSTSRILDNKNKIIDIVNNYSKISFNFGATLLTWMETNNPDVYQYILDADKESQIRFSGHGNALAQAYNHIIMPLANRRDKYTQVLWGIKDFEKRFRRFPEGMWLPETAVDLETLDIMAELGIRFTILAQHQAKQIRQRDSNEWEDVSGAHIDPTRAYELNLLSGRKIAVFFYNGPVSRAVAFEGLLSSGENFAKRLLGEFSSERNRPQITNIATDGESYGHHHRFGDMALSYALNYIETRSEAKLTNYGEFLEKYPPTHLVEIFENTSWSCFHGIERWRANCGCNSGAHPGWNQEWRGPLRQALDWLRNKVIPEYEKRAGQFLKDPWAARDDFIYLLLDRSMESRWQFFAKQAVRELTEEEVITSLKLLELQRHTMLMYTSCGWFFDDISGIETIQVLQYAGRVVQLVQDLFGDNIEEDFLKLLEPAQSNVPQYGDGRRIYDDYVRPAVIDLGKVAAHYAISSLFEKYSEQTRIYSYEVDVKSSQMLDCGRTRVIVGRAGFTSEITQESDVISYGVLHFGDHNVSAGIRRYAGEEGYQEMLQEITQTCAAADFHEAIRLLDKHFGTSTYSLKSLFRDEQSKVLNEILESTISDAESTYRQTYQTHYPLMRFLTDLGNPLPVALKAAAEFVINTDLQRSLAAETPDFESIKRLLDDSRIWKIQLDTEGLGHVFKKTLENKMNAFAGNPTDIDLLSMMESLMDLVQISPFIVNTRRVQNIYFKLLKDITQIQQKTGDEWKPHFLALGKKLSIHVS